MQDNCCQCLLPRCLKIACRIWTCDGLNLNKLLYQSELMQLSCVCCKHLSAVTKRLKQVLMFYRHILISEDCCMRFSVCTWSNGAGRGRETWTPAPVTRPGSLASCSLHQLEYPPVMQGTLADLSAKGPINPVLYDCCQCLFQDALFAYRIRTCYLLSDNQIL